MAVDVICHRTQRATGTVVGVRTLVTTRGAGVGAIAERITGGASGSK
jgi:hypothetical protein